MHFMQYLWTSLYKGKQTLMISKIVRFTKKYFHLFKPFQQFNWVQITDNFNKVQISVNFERSINFWYMSFRKNIFLQLSYQNV